jgi:hypothetical protein
VGIVTPRASAALDYAWRGIPVFPLAVRGKLPAIPAAHPNGDPQRGVCHGECGRQGHGLYDATSDPAQVRRWWTERPYANLGVPCGPASGWLVVDLDGAEAEAVWMRLEELHGPAPTLTSRTGRGRHLVYEWPEGCEIGNTSGRLGPHVDTRGIGGYVCVPPSVHPSGATYHYDRSGIYAPQKPPSWLLGPLSETAPAPPRRSTPGGLCVGGGVPPGLPRHLQAQAGEAPGADRSRQTYRLIAAAVEWGLDDSTILQLALSHQPTVDKYGDGDRAREQVFTIIDRVRPDHPHQGKPCDLAGCPRAPRWMGVSA